MLPAVSTYYNLYIQLDTHARSHGVSVYPCIRSTSFVGMRCPFGSMWEALSTLHHSFGDPEPRRVSGEDGWMSCEATSHLERSPKLAPQKSQEPKIFTKKNSDCREERKKLT